MKLLGARLNNSGDLPKSHGRFTNSIVKNSSKCGRSAKRRVTRRRQPGSPLNRHEKQPKMHVSATVEAVRATADILSANLEQMKYLEEMRRVSHEMKDLIKKPASN